MTGRRRAASTLVARRRRAPAVCLVGEPARPSSRRGAGTTPRPSGRWRPRTFVRILAGLVLALTACADRDAPADASSNAPPVLDALPDLTFIENAPDHSLALEDHVDDLEDGYARLTVDASSDEEGVARPIVNQDRLYVAVEGVGTATLTVRATDSEGASTSTSFRVEVMPLEGGVLVEGAHVAPHGAVAFSPDGRLLAVGTTTGLIYDAASLEELARLQPIEIAPNRFSANPRIGSVAWNPDGSRFVASGAQTWIYDPVSGSVVERLLDGEGRAVDWSPDGERIAAGGSLWDAETGDLLWEYANPRTSRSAHLARFSPTAEHVALASADLFGPVDALLVRAADGEEAHLLPSDTQGVAFAPTGDALVYADLEELVVLGYPGFEERRRAPHGVDARIDALAWGDAGIFIGARDGTIRRFDANLSLGAESASLGPTYVADLAVRPGGSEVAAATYSDGVVFLDPETLDRRGGLLASAGRVEAVHAGDDRIASGGEDGRVRIWDRRTGDLLATLVRGRRGIDDIAVSPDGRSLWAVGGANDDASLNAWDLTSYEPIGVTTLPLAFALELIPGPATDQVTAFGMVNSGAYSGRFAKIVISAVTLDVVDIQPVSGGIAFDANGAGTAVGLPDRVLVTPTDPALDPVVLEGPVDAQIMSVALSHDGTLVAAGFFASDELYVWDVPSETIVFAGEMFPEPGVDGRFTNDLEFSPTGGRLLAVGLVDRSQRNAVRVYDVRTWQGLSVKPFGDRYGLASYDATWTPDGDVVVGDWGGKIASFSLPDDWPRDGE